MKNRFLEAIERFNIHKKRILEEKNTNNYVNIFNCLLNEICDFPNLVVGIKEKEKETQHIKDLRNRRIYKLITLAENKDILLLIININKIHYKILELTSLLYVDDWNYILNDRLTGINLDLGEYANKKYTTITIEIEEIFFAYNYKDEFNELNGKLIKMLHESMIHTMYWENIAHTFLQNSNINSSRWSYNILDNTQPLMYFSFKSNSKIKK